VRDVNASTALTIEESDMSVKLLAALFVLTSAPAMALPPPNQILSGGDNTVVSGIAHVYDDALGTYVLIDRPASVSTIVGFIPWGDQHAYPELPYINGRMVQIYGPVALDGWPLIIMTDPNQLNATE
jgi:hypothetical protein